MIALKTLGSRGGVLLAFAVLTAGLALAPPVALAQQADDDRIEAVEREVRELRRLLEELRSEGEKAAVAAEETTAATTPPAEGDRFDELARRIDLLSAEVERLALGDEVAPQVAGDGEHGLSPSASKVYRSEGGLSLGGYGELLYQSFDSSADDGSPSGATDEIDALRAILYVGYKFNDHFVFNSEIEFEHTEEAEVEFAYVDYLWRPELNLRGGLLLAPMGWINELHEPTVFLSARRPDTERLILPTTWREDGFGVWGEAGSLSYRAYVLNGFDASGFSAAGLRGGKQNGGEAKAEDFAFVGRLDWTPTPGVVLGGSLYSGGAGQDVVDPLDGRQVGAETTIWEAHAEWKYRGLRARGLIARAEVDDVAGLNRALGLSGDRSVGEELEGWYAELGYDVLAGRGGRSLTPFVRWEEVDTQAAVPAGFRRDPARDFDSLTIGVAFQPIDRLIFKLDYQDYENAAGNGVDQLNVALGYIF